MYNYRLVHQKRDYSAPSCMWLENTRNTASPDALKKENKFIRIYYNFTFQVDLHFSSVKIKQNSKIENFCDF